MRRAYVGFWFFAFPPTDVELRRVKDLFGCVPVVFPSPTEMWAFLDSVRRRL